MTTFHTNELAFELPPVETIDRSVNILETVAPSGGEITILVQRFPVPEGKSLRELSAIRVSNATRTRAGYKVLSQADTEVAGAAAIEVAARWRADVGIVFVKEIHFSLGPIWMVIAGHGPLADRAHTEERLAHVLGSARVREGDGRAL